MTNRASASRAAGMPLPFSAIHMAALFAIQMACVAYVQAATPTVTTLGSLPATVAVGTGLTLSATVVKTTIGLPAGTVQFKDGATLLKSVRLSNGRATTTLPAFTEAGAHRYTATFIPDSTSLSSSASQGWNVNAKYNSLTDLTVFPGTRAGQMMGFVAAVQATGAATGTVRFLDGNTVLGTVAVSNGEARLFRSVAAEGEHQFTAEYVGDSRTLPSQSGQVAVTLTGRDYFVGSGVNASDANEGTESSPWATLDKVSKLTGLVNNDLSGTAKYGIRLQCGGEWREQLNITPAMVANPAVDQVEIGRWGVCSSGNLPRINAGLKLDPLRWQKTSGKQYQYTYQFNPGEVPSGINQLFIRNGANFVQLQEARHPNVGFWSIAGDPGDPQAKPARGPESHKDLLKVSAEDFKTLSSQGAGALDGAQVHVRSATFRFEDRGVASLVADGDTYNQGGGKLVFGPTPVNAQSLLAYGATYGFGYMLTGKAWMIDQPGEWAYDAATNSLQLWAPASVDPGALVIEASVRDFGVKSQGVKVSLKGLAVRLAKKDGVSVNEASNSLVKGLDIAYSGENGIAVDFQGGNTKNLTIDGNKVSFSRSSGIVTGSYRSSVKVINNTVTDIGNYLEPHDVGAAIAVDINGPDRAEITGNTVMRVGGGGIVHVNVALRPGDSPGIEGEARFTQVVGNTIDSYCERMDDCGGIYTYGGNGVYLRTYPLSEGGGLLARGTLIKHNVVRNGVGGMQGVHGSVPTGVIGIYMDDYATNVTVESNVVANTLTGVVLHNNSKMKVKGNSLFAVSRACLAVDNTGLGLNGEGKSRVDFDGLRDIPPVSVFDNRCVTGGVYVRPTAQVKPDFNFSQRSALAMQVLQNENTPLTGLGTTYDFHNNQYQGLYEPVKFGIEEWYQGRSRNLNLNRWTSVAEATVAGQVEPTPILAPYRFTPTGPNLVSNSTMDIAVNGALAGWRAGINAQQETAACESSTGACGAQNGPLGASDTNVFTAEAGADYLVSVRLRTPNTESRISDGITVYCGDTALPEQGHWAYQHLPSTGWHQIQLPFYVPSVAEMGRACTSVGLSYGLFSGYLSPKVDVNGETKAAGGKQALQWDDLVIQKGTVSYGTTTDDYRVVVNASDVPAPVPCPDGANSSRCTQYVDLDRKPVNWLVDKVPARGARMVIWTGSPFYNPQ